MNLSRSGPTREAFGFHKSFTLCHHALAWKKSRQLQLSCYCQHKRAQFSLSCGTFGRLGRAAARKKKKGRGCFKSVPLSCKLQPCIFNFLSTYNVIHWSPSQTRTHSHCDSREQTILFCSVLSCQKHD